MAYFIKTEFQCLEDLTDIIEDSFDTCISNRDEIAWLISMIRGIMSIPNKRTEFQKDNIRINWWQNELYEPLEQWKRYYCISTSQPRQEWTKYDEWGNTQEKTSTHKSRKIKKTSRSFIKPSGTLF